MVAITVKYDANNVLRLLNDKVRRQIPFATSRAINEIAKKVQKQVQVELSENLDRPTPFVLRSIFVKYSTKGNLAAKVYLRNQPLAKNPSSLAEILEQQFAGGTRIRTRLESALTRAGYISSNEYIAPGAGAKKDQYGNMSRGQIQQVLSQLFASPLPEANRSSSTRSKLSVKRAGRIFWSRGETLPRGAWIDGAAGLRPLLLVISQPRYKKRIDMERIAKQVVDRDFDRTFKQEFDNAVRTAR